MLGNGEWSGREKMLLCCGNFVEWRRGMDTRKFCGTIRSSQESWKKWWDSSKEESWNEDLAERGVGGERGSQD